MDKICDNVNVSQFFKVGHEVKHYNSDKFSHCISVLLPKYIKDDQSNWLFVLSEALYYMKQT